MRSDREWLILFLTDIHYQESNYRYLDDDKEMQIPDFRDEIYPQVARFLKYGFDFEMSGRGRMKRRVFDLIVVGGDLTTRGKAEGFQEFREQMLKHLVELTTSPDAICLVPGNHDVAWGFSSKEPQPKWKEKFNSFLGVAGGEGYELTTCLYPDGGEKEFKFVPPPKPFKGPIYHSPPKDKAIIALCINSASRCGEFNDPMAKGIATALREFFSNSSGPHSIEKEKMLIEALKTSARKLHFDDNEMKLLEEFFHQGADDASKRKCESFLVSLASQMVRDIGHVMPLQREMLENELRSLKDKCGATWDSYLRVAILHHHLSQFPGQTVEHKGYEAVVDAQATLEWLASQDIDLVLMGHKHHPYQYVYRLPHDKTEREIVLIGGTTVGSYAVDGTFRGFRVIKVRQERRSRSFSIFDVSHNATSWQEERRRPPHETLHRNLSVFESRSSRAKFGYDEIESVTALSPEGDAKRVLRFKGLRILDENSDRRKWHKLQLPAASGYISKERVKGYGCRCEISERPDPHEIAHSRHITISFPGQLQTDSSFDYEVNWFAVNSFAMNKREFCFKYTNAYRIGRNVEFTYFRSKEPTRALKIIVQFPRGFRPETDPQIWVGLVDEGKNPRNWDIDARARKELQSERALTYDATLGMARLAIREPDENLAYGIQWDLPSPDVSQLDIDRLKMLSAYPIDREKVATILAGLLELAHKELVPDWAGRLDMSLMIFDGNWLGLEQSVTELKWPPDEKLPLDAKLFARSEGLAYGNGIAGRALKSRKVFVFDEWDQDNDEQPQLYVWLTSQPAHKVLIAFPILPTVDKGKSEYATPFAIVNLGSTVRGCPLSRLRVADSYTLAGTGARFATEVQSRIQELFKGCENFG
jgi:3',5'-cyclic AMP phosphodiesterase CpdA